MKEPRVGERKLSAAEWAWHLLVFAVIGWIIFFVEAK